MTDGFFGPDKTTDELSVPGLAKLLMYDNFVRARALAASKTIKEVVEEELDLYPYSRKDTFQEPYVAPVDLSFENTDFTPGLTDAGVCQVYNGDSMLSSFVTSLRIDELQYSLDPRPVMAKPRMINGTGKISQITMWLDAGNKYIDNIESYEKDEGSLMIAINDWQTYYDVKINQLDLRAGTDVIIKVKPVVYNTTAEFKALKLDDRQCRYRNEQEVCATF